MTTLPQPEDSVSPRHSRKDDRDRYPVAHLIGVIDTKSDFDAAFAALGSAGFPEIDILVGTGDDGGPAPAPALDRSKVVQLLVRFGEWLGFKNEPQAVKNLYEQAMRENRFVVCVSAPTYERRRTATHILQQHGGHTIKFMGDMLMEDVTPVQSPPDPLR